MELKEGMYVRLDRCQGIAKIDEYDEECNVYHLDKSIYDEWGDESCFLILDDVLDASFDIKDLIEEYDYVRFKGEKDFHIVSEFLNENLVFTGPGFGDWKYMDSSEVEIDAVITREQIENIMYEVN